MGDERKGHPAGDRAAGAVVLCLGLAVFGVLAFALRKVTLPGHVPDIGDIAVLSVFALFGCFCAFIGWRLLRTPSAPVASGASPIPPAPAAAPSKRVTLSHGCAAAGVVLLMLSVLVPAHWYPVALFLLGLALLAVAHGLTPCVERIEQLRKARESERQL